MGKYSLYWFSLQANLKEFYKSFVSKFDDWRARDPENDNKIRQAHM